MPSDNSRRWKSERRSVDEVHAGTDTCGYLLNRRDRSLEATFEEHAGAICISAIAHAELCYGVEHSTQVDRNRHELAEFLRDLDVVAFDRVAGSHYGDLRETLTRKGTPIGANDLLIAAHAKWSNTLEMTCQWSPERSGHRRLRRTGAVAQT